MLRVSSRLKEVREGKGLSQNTLIDQVKEKTGYPISQPMLSQYESGKRPVPDDAKYAIATTLGMSVDEIFYRPVETQSGPLPASRLIELRDIARSAKGSSRTNWPPDEAAKIVEELLSARLKHGAAIGIP